VEVPINGNDTRTLFSDFFVFRDIPTMTYAYRHVSIRYSNPDGNKNKIDLCIFSSYIYLKHNLKTLPRGKKKIRAIQNSTVYLYINRPRHYIIGCTTTTIFHCGYCVMISRRLGLPVNLILVDSTRFLCLTIVIISGYENCLSATESNSRRGPDAYLYRLVYRSMAGRNIIRYWARR